MSEQNFRHEEPPNKFEGYYHWLATKFPEGLAGAKNAIPVNIDGNEMEVVILPPESNTVSFGLYLHDQKYSRKTIIINETGQVTEDTTGVLPDFDRAESEPKITSSNEQIVATVMEALKSKFPDKK